MPAQQLTNCLLQCTSAMTRDYPDRNRPARLLANQKRAGTPHRLVDTKPVEIKERLL